MDFSLERALLVSLLGEPLEENNYSDWGWRRKKNGWWGDCRIYVTRNIKGNWNLSIAGVSYSDLSFDKLISLISDPEFRKKHRFRLRKK